MDYRNLRVGISLVNKVYQSFLVIGEKAKTNGIHF